MFGVIYFLPINACQMVCAKIHKKNIRRNCVSSNFQVKWNEVDFIAWVAKRLMRPKVHFVISASLMSLLLLYPKTPRNGLLVIMFLSHISRVLTLNQTIKQVKATCLHASHYHHCNYCHYSNIGFALFHNVTCSTNSLLARIYVNP